ncbi:UNVERIFIED_CONTAM: Serine/threonine-protein kinase STY46 [Sesamum radiatum]|uniref:Serine/threonine-protein kinase STY46 n=1 Tax=Sesamum radiatum TaxID=300843 RepID=A0AAW2PYP4_SESRA
MGDSEGCSSRQSEWSPVQSRKRRQKVEVFHEVLQRLKELDVEEAAEPGFEDELWAHFTMLPLRYALDVNTERAEDVLTHKKLLNMARDPLTRPAVDVRLVQLPYAHLTPLQAAVGVVQKGLRPAIPRNTHPLLVELLEKCWQQDPSLRPEFSEILEILQYMGRKMCEEERATKRQNLGDPCQLVDEWPLKMQENENAA